MERVDNRLIASEEMYKNLSETVASLRLEVKNLTSVVFPEQQSKPATLEFPTDSATQAFVKAEVRDSFVSCHFFINLFR